MHETHSHKGPSSVPAETSPCTKVFVHLAVASSVTRGTDGKKYFLHMRCLVASYIKCILQCIFCNTTLSVDLCGLMEENPTLPSRKVSNKCLVLAKHTAGVGDASGHGVVGMWQLE